MTEDMFQVIAIGLERIIIFVLELAAGAAGGNHGGDVLVGDLEIGHPAVEVERFAFEVGNRQFTPVDLDGIFAFD